MKTAPTAGPRWSSRRALVVAAVGLLIVDRFVPFGGLLLYPFTLLATWVHEMGHGIAALVVGGRFESLAIYRDASGLALTAASPGWRGGVVAAAGLLAPPIVGSSILAFARGPRRARIALGVLAGAIVLSLVFWVRSVLGLLVMPGVAAVLVISVAALGENRRLLFAQLLGLTLALDTMARWDYLFTGSAVVGGELRTSDIAAVATAFGGPRLLWGLLVAALSAGMVSLGLWAAWRQRPRSRLGRR